MKLQCQHWWRKLLWSYENIQNIWKIGTEQEDDYTIGCSLDYPCLKNYYKMIAMDLRKQQELNADPKGIKQNNFTGNLDEAGNTTMFFIIEE